MSTLPVTETVAFDRQRNAVDYSYLTGSARNTADHGQLNIDEGLALGRLNRDLTRGRNALPGGFSGRGLFGSGLYRQGLEDFSERGTDALSNLRNDFSRRRTDLFAQLSAMDANRAVQMADIDLNQATRRSAIASVLQGVG